jgi:hypothetical protein
LRQPRFSDAADQVEGGGAEGDSVSGTGKVVRRISSEVLAESELCSVPSAPEVVHGGRGDPSSALRVGPSFSSFVSFWMDRQLRLPLLVV